MPNYCVTWVGTACAWVCLFRGFCHTIVLSQEGEVWRGLLLQTDCVAAVLTMVMTKLTPRLLVAAYAQGFFPMDVDGQIEWFSPDPRAILPLEGFHASKTLLQTYRTGRFQIRLNTAFVEVVRRCGDREEGSWISKEIVRAYSELHRLGLAHSVEAWQDDTLAGGLYGVAIGGAFFGESMFHHERDASKVALVALVKRMRDRGFALLDVQWTTTHLVQFGAVEIPRDAYLERLAAALRLPCRIVDRGQRSTSGTLP